MLTTTPKQGDRVLVVPKSWRNDRESKLLPVEKVGRKWLYVELQGVKQQFSFEGRNEWFELWDSREAYDLIVQRGRRIAKIKIVVSASKFGDGLTDETLDQILGLIKVES